MKSFLKESWFKISLVLLTVLALLLYSRYLNLQVAKHELDVRSDAVSHCLDGDNPTEESARACIEFLGEARVETGSFQDGHQIFSN